MKNISELSNPILGRYPFKSTINSYFVIMNKTMKLINV